jgi:16S rRNA (cytosine967-C5)-methyltransferase
MGLIEGDPVFMKKESPAAVSNTREIAYDFTRRVNDEGAYLGLLIRYRLGRSGLSSRDRALVSELAYGIQRNRGKLDYIIANFSRKPIDKIEPEVLDLLRLGVYQITEMRVPDHAAVNETVELAKKRLHSGSVSFINAILRNTSSGYGEISWPGRDDFGTYLEIMYSHPRWLADYILEYSNQDKDLAEAHCKANNFFKGLTLRVNLSKLDRESLLSKIRTEDGRAYTSPRLREALTDVFVSWDGLQELLNKGLCVVQDESSMLVSQVVRPEPNMTIIDSCAAPGGKAIHMAQLGGEDCRVFALDTNPSRLEALRNMADRLGVKNVIPIEGDGTLLNKYVERPADAVLVDAPCSGLGTLRHRPELKWRRAPEELQTFSETQLALLEGAAAMVRPGGGLVYSVCTFSSEETTHVLDTFSGRHPEYHLENVSVYLPPHLSSYVSRQGYIQLLPHLHDMEGMFIARLVRH